MARNFMQLLQERWDQHKFLCVGLDSDYEKIPTHLRTINTGLTMVNFNRAIIEHTHEQVCAYKINAAFYEQQGLMGLSAMHQTFEVIQKINPSIPIIWDAKRADIGNTNKGYADAAFNFLQADAITVHPYLGQEALTPLLDKYPNKGIIVLCRTSNPGAAEFQDLMVNEQPLYMHVAHNVATRWNTHGNCGLVVGATYPQELAKVRAAVGNLPILIPGIGAQGGDLTASVQAGRNSKNQGIIINVSRDVIFTSSEKDFAFAAAHRANELDSAIRASLAIDIGV